MRFGSLFSGIGGIDLGLERAGMTCAWQVEADPYCRAVLARHWPDVPRFDDVRTFDGPEHVDLIAGGFPCQDISQAGKRKGIEHGERSGLWREFARIVRVLRPRFVLVENVSALLAGDLGVVLGDLAELGFDAEWTCLSAADLGAPHLRKRVFVVAARRPVPDAFDAVLRFERERLGQQRGVARATEPGRDGARLANADGGSGGQSREDSGRSSPRDGADERPGLGRVGTQSVAEPDRRRGHGGSDDARRQHEEAKGAGAGPAIARQSHVADSDSGGLKGKRVTRLEQPGHAGAPGNEPDGRDLPQWPPAPNDVLAWGAVPAAAQPALCRLADGLPAEMGRGRRAALKGLGNACVPAKAELIGRRLMSLVQDGAA